MTDLSFFAPVEVVLDPKQKCVVSSVWEGLEFLSQHQPAAPGPCYRAALRTSRDALDGWQPVAKARRAFVAAAREAHILAKH